LCHEIVRRLSVLLAFALVPSACAFTTVPLTLPIHALAKPISGGNGRQVIVVVPFSDERQIRDRCGMKKNGYNMDTADALCQSDPNAWIATLLARELRASGFTVVDDKAAHRPGALRVEGSLLKIFVEPVIGFWSGSVEADVSIRLMFALGCRHVVVERDAGRVDSARSITSSSDQQWSVKREPAPSETDTPQP